ncbi:MAG: hypothetical protein AAFX56_07235 [Pseudomonadota bacterium]
MRHYIAVTLMSSLLSTGMALADDNGAEQQRGDRRGPPEAALEACSASVQGDPCAFESRRGDTLDGTCEARDDKPLACRPEGGRKNQKLRDE